jgi:uncharacterized ion transporter superfamily protein YfcC
LILLAVVATWVVPGGAYERVVEQVAGTSRTVVVPGSFHFVPGQPQLLELFTAPIRGFLKLAEIIAFIFILGGAFAMLDQTGAIAAGIRRLVRLLRGREIYAIPLVMTLFSFFGAAFGMCEEAMPFVLVFVPLSLALGYDSLVGVSLTFVAAGVGFAGAFFNPFTLQIAQGLAGLQPLSGMGYRLVIWTLATALAIAWVTVYARKIRRHPEQSPMYLIDQRWREQLAAQQPAGPDRLSLRHGLCLLLLLGTIVTMILGVILGGWYIQELAGVFLAMGLLTGLTAGMGPSRLARAFVFGAKDIAPAALIVGFAGGILVILEQGRILDTLLYAMASVSGRLPPLLAADAQYLLQLTVNFFIPSGSTKAALTMPLMAPLADLSGITRQTAVLAYQLGDGFTNLIIPTSGVTMGTLAMARIPYGRWLRWHLPLQLLFVVLSLLLLVWPVLSGWS